MDHYAFLYFTSFLVCHTAEIMFVALIKYSPKCKFVSIIKGQFSITPSVLCYILNFMISSQCSVLGMSCVPV